jgi:hypothetical protein
VLSDPGVSDPGGFESEILILGILFIAVAPSKKEFLNFQKKCPETANAIANIKLWTKATVVLDPFDGNLTKTPGVKTKNNTKIKTEKTTFIYTLNKHYFHCVEKSKGNSLISVL